MNLSEDKAEVTNFLLSSGNIDKEFIPGYRTIDLYKLVKNNNLNMVKYLLGNKVGFSPNALACILWYAISHEYHELAKLLVEHGADVNQRGLRNNFYDHRISLLSWAVYWKNKHSVKLLLKHGAKVNDFDLLGMGALYFAISRRQVKIARLLLDNGANINCKDDHGNSMLHVAAGTGVSDMIKLVNKFSADVNDINNYGQNALHYAVQGPYDFKHIVVLLVKLGVPINGLDNHNETPLHYALSLRKSRMASVLIEYCANVNALSKDKIFPLFLAAIDGCSHDLVKIILQNGANVNERTIDGETALHCACRNEDHELIAFLVANKADVNILNEEEQTPLALIKDTNSKAAQVLLEHIAQMKIKRSFISQKNLELIAKDFYLHRYFEQYNNDKDQL